MRGLGGCGRLGAEGCEHPLGWCVAFGDVENCLIVSLSITGTMHGSSATHMCAYAWVSPVQRTSYMCMGS